MEFAQYINLALTIIVSLSTVIGIFYRVFKKYIRNEVHSVAYEINKNDRFMKMFEKETETLIKNSPEVKAIKNDLDGLKLNGLRMNIMLTMHLVETNARDEHRKITDGEYQIVCGQIDDYHRENGNSYIHQLFDSFTLKYKNPTWEIKKEK